MSTLAPAFVSIILYSLMSLFSTILYSILLLSINILKKKIVSSREFGRDALRHHIDFYTVK